MPHGTCALRHPCFCILHTWDDARFTVQLSSGGGQFIDVHTGYTGQENFTLGINRSGVSDIRVVCRTGGIKVADIEMTK